MSNPASEKFNVGAYTTPYSGVGIEYAPLNSVANYPSPLLHEVGYLPQNKKWNFSSVLSPFWRLYHNSDPGHRVQLNGVAHKLKPGYCYFIPDHQLFHCSGHVPVRTFWTHFSMPRSISVNQPVPVILQAHPVDADIISNISQQIEQGLKPELKAQLFHSTLALLHLLLARADIAWKPHQPDTLIRLIEFIKSHLNEKMPNQRLAKEAGMSVESLSRLFRNHLNISPAQYVNKIRISHASHMLEQTDMTIDFIAEITGFPNRAYFSRVFKQVSTLSPAEFRTRKKNYRTLSTQQIKNTPATYFSE